MDPIAEGSAIKGSTLLIDLFRRYPGGEASELMRRLYWPCMHCGGALSEPLTMAARRHRNSPRAVLTAFRALEAGALTEQLIAEAGRKVERVGHLR